MEGFASRQDLVPPARVLALSARSDAKGGVRLVFHGLLLAATGMLVWRAAGSIWLAPAMVAHGIVLVFLFCGFHECIHRTAFRSRRVNDAVAAALGTAVFYPPYAFRLYHFAHHRFTQDPARDPELNPPPPETAWGRILWVSGITYWPAQLGMTLKPALTGRVRRAYVRDRDVPICVAEARWMWAAYALVAAVSLWAQSWAALVCWIGPLVLGQPVLRLYLLAEHAGCPMVDDMTANTRTVRTNRLVRLLAWNMPLHAEHHLFPSIPFHALPAVHADVKMHLKHLNPGYLAAHRKIWRRGREMTEPAHG